MADKYDIQARYTPALLCSVPFMLLGFYFLNNIDSAFWSSAFGMSIGSLSLSAAMYVLASHSCQIVGKVLEERIFNNGDDFPTTTFLLDSDTSLTPERKKMIYSKINKEFGVDLNHKTSDSPKNRRLIHECVGQIRSKFFKKNEMVLQRNIQFGFAKNLAGGSLIAILACIVGLAVSQLINNPKATSLSLVLLLIYVIVGVGAYFSIRFTAKHYANTLFDEFLRS